MAEPVTINIPHQLGHAEARRRVEDGFGDLAKQIGGMGAVTKRWDGDRMSFSLKVLGQGVTGVMDVADSAVKLEIMLPGLLAAMANKVKGALQKQGHLMLEKK